MARVRERETVALDRFVGGRTVKWTIQFDTSKSDDANLGVDVFGPGWTVAM